MRFSEFLFRSLSSLAFLGFRQGPFDSRRKPVEAVLQDIVPRPAGQNLNGTVFRNRSRYQDERDPGKILLRKSKRLDAAIQRKIVIREDQVGCKFLEDFFISLFGLNDYSGIAVYGIAV